MPLIPSMYGAKGLSNKMKLRSTPSEKDDHKTNE
jgi:hypothetical protein